MSWRTSQLLAASLSGALIAGSLALALLGFAPAYVEPEGDERDVCRRGPSRQALAIIEPLEEIGVAERFADRWAQHTGEPHPPPLQLSAARCGDGVEVDPVPLMPARRATWLATLEATLAEDTIEAVRSHTADQLAELQHQHQSARAAQRSLTVEAVSLAQDVDLVEVLTADPAEVSPELRRLTTAVFEDLARVEAEVAALDAESERWAARADDVETFARQAEVIAPATPYPPLLAAAISGALVGLALALGRARRSTGPPAEPAAALRSPSASPSGGEGGR